MCSVYLHVLGVYSTPWMTYCSAGWRRLLASVCFAQCSPEAACAKMQTQPAGCEAGLWRNVAVPASDTHVAELFGQLCLLVSWKVPLGEGAAGSYPLELGEISLWTASLIQNAKGCMDLWRIWGMSEQDTNPGLTCHCSHILY